MSSPKSKTKPSKSLGKRPRRKAIAKPIAAPKRDNAIVVKAEEATETKVGKMEAAIPQKKQTLDKTRHYALAYAGETCYYLQDGRRFSRRTLEEI